MLVRRRRCAPARLRVLRQCMQSSLRCFTTVCGSWKSSGDPSCICWSPAWAAFNLFHEKISVVVVARRAEPSSGRVTWGQSYITLSLSLFPFSQFFSLSWFWQLLPVLLSCKTLQTLSLTLTHFFFSFILFCVCVRLISLLFSFKTPAWSNQQREKCLEPWAQVTQCFCRAQRRVT